MSIINSRRLQGLWADAQRKPEWATTRLWEYIFKEKVFKGESWSIASQQPPTDEDSDLRRVDLVPEYSDDTGAWTRVLFFEAKRASATPSDLETVEFQAFTACCAYLHYFKKQSVWAVTAFGGKARLWAYRAGDDYLTPWVPNSDGLGAPNEYIEANSSNGQLILNGLKYIRDHREPRSKNFDVASSPRPANVSLPKGWNDTEVNLVARPSSSPRTQGVGNVQYPQDTLLMEASSSANTPAYQQSGGTYYGEASSSANTPAYQQSGGTYYGEASSSANTPAYQQSGGTYYGEASSSANTPAYQQSGGTYYGEASSSANTPAYQQSMQTTQGHPYGNYSQGMQQGSSSSYPPTSSGPYTYAIPSSADTEMAEDDEDNEEDEDDEEDEVEVYQHKEDSGRSNHVVKVKRIKRYTHKDQFIFKDRKGKTRKTKLEDWTEIVDQGQRAWKYKHYICYENVFK